MLVPVANMLRCVCELLCFWGRVFSLDCSSPFPHLPHLPQLPQGRLQYNVEQSNLQTMDALVKEAIREKFIKQKMGVDGSIMDDA